MEDTEALRLREAIISDADGLTKLERSASLKARTIRWWPLVAAGSRHVRDLPLSNPAILIASVLGYASTAAAIDYLVLMARTRPAERSSSARRPWD